MFWTRGVQRTAAKGPLPDKNHSILFVEYLKYPPAIFKACQGLVKDGKG